MKATTPATKPSKTTTTKTKRRATGALGRKVTQFRRFDTFIRPTHVHSVTMVSDEFTALCPVTKQPDWYTVRITYTPNGLCLESKSLKLYLHAFRGKGAFCEALAHRIAHEVSVALAASVVVLLTQKSRGGVSIEARAGAYEVKS